MRRHIPSLTMLLSFEAAARYGSLARAADELSLSPSAVSRSLQGLEEFLGFDLFTRSRQRLALNEAGRSYARAVSELLEKLETETAMLVARSQSDPVLQLAIYPTFGSRWLMPRLPDFTGLNEDLKLNFTTGVTPFNVHSGDIDIAIQHGQGNWPNSFAVKLWEETLSAVVSPDALQNPVGRPSDIYGHLLLTLRTRTTDWEKWFAQQNLSPPEGRVGPVFETFGLLIGAVRAGLGVAVVPSLYVQDDIRDGRLIEGFGPPVSSNAAFYAVCDDSRSKEPKIKRFMSWIAAVSEARCSPSVTQD